MQYRSTNIIDRAENVSVDRAWLIYSDDNFRISVFKTPTVVNAPTKHGSEAQRKGEKKT